MQGVVQQKYLGETQPEQKSQSIYRVSHLENDLTLTVRRDAPRYPE